MNQELYHHGVKGMKWGVRRYQNADGSRTALGKRRAARKELRADRKAYDKERKDNWKAAKKQGNSATSFVKTGVATARSGGGVRKTLGSATKASLDAKAFRKTDEYKNARTDIQRLHKEKNALSKRERDKLYRDVRNGKDYKKSYMKAWGRQLAKNIVSETTKSYAKKAVGAAVVAAGAKYVENYMKSRSNTQPKLPAGNIIDVTDFTVLN